MLYEGIAEAVDAANITSLTIGILQLIVCYFKC